MSGTLQDLIVFRLNLKKRKDKFNKHRLSDDDSSTDSIDETKLKSEKPKSSKDSSSKSEEVVSSVKSYTEKIKLGFFGKKTRRA